MTDAGNHEHWGFPMDNSEFLTHLQQTCQAEFVRSKGLLTLDEYLSLVMETPRRFARSAVNYVLDTFDHWGRKPSGKGFALFEAPFDPDTPGVMGQEDAQESLYLLLKSFAATGRADKVMVMYGPTGSAKSSLSLAIMQAMEAYSRTDEGALYRFNWIFPVEKLERESLGFVTPEARDRSQALQSYALLEESHVAMKVPCELRDSPLLLIPPRQRGELLDGLKDRLGGMTLSQHIRKGDLSPKSKAIFQSLLAAYGGDILNVYRHIQVERYELSLRYKQGLVVLQPEMAVDAGLRQVAMDLRYANLPPVLKAVPMFEPVGKLIDANHGVLEYADMFKRPVDSFKYLLGTCEKGSINLDMALLDLDIVFMASTNDQYIHAFRQLAEYPSFRGRMEFIKVPYLLDFHQEQAIYDRQVRFNPDLPRAPHITALASLWAVMTRMRPPDPAQYSQECRDLIKGLTPLDKALLYAGDVLAWTNEEQQHLLAACRQAMQEEYSLRPDYEGVAGASPREVKQLLTSYGQHQAAGFLSPIGLMRDMEALIQQRGSYPFLDIEPQGLFMDQVKILDLLHNYYYRTVDGEIKSCLNLVESSRYHAMLKRYVEHVSAMLKKEQVYDTATRSYQPPSVAVMDEFETMLNIAANRRAEYRSGVLSRIAGYTLDHQQPGEKPVYLAVFDKELKQLEAAYYQQQQQHIHELCRQALALQDRPLDENREADIHLAETRGLVSSLEDRYGYPRTAIPELLNYYLSRGSTGS